MTETVYINVLKKPQTSGHRYSVQALHTNMRMWIYLVEHYFAIVCYILIDGVVFITPIERKILGYRNISLTNVPVSQENTLAIFLYLPHKSAHTGCAKSSIS